MTKENKQLLLMDLCARLPYNTKILHNGELEVLSTLHIFDMQHIKEEYVDIKPYLRSPSTMTKEERETFASKVDNFYPALKHTGVDYLNSIHVDYRGLIVFGLALEAPADMYK